MKRIKSKMLSFSILLLLILPSLTYVILNLSSLSYGFTIGLVFFTIVISFEYSVISLRKLSISMLFLSLLLLTILINGTDIKNLGSLFIVFLILFSANIFSLYIKNNDPEYLANAIVNVTMILMIFGVIGVLFKLNLFGYQNYAKSIFIFYEPSHYAIVTGPFFIITMLIKPKIRVIISVCFLFVAIMISNLTMIIYWLLGMVLCIKNKRNIIILLTSISIAIFILYLNYYSYLTYYIERVSISSDSTNISTLVYMQGWQEAYKSLCDTYGLGLGFQHAGTNIPSEIANKIYFLLGDYKNRNDMGFFMAKLIVEFGLLGVLFIFYYVSVIFKFYKSRNLNKNNLIVWGMLVSSIVEVFFRSPGYFTIGVYFLFVGLFFNVNKFIEKYN